MTINDNQEYLDVFAKKRCSIYINKKEIMAPSRPENLSSLTIYDVKSNNMNEEKDY